MKAKKGSSVPISRGKYNIAAERAENVIGARIAEARRRRGWSLTALSAALKDYGVDLGNAAISKWEVGDSVPNAYQFLAVCRALDMEDSLSTYQADHMPDLNDEGLRKVAEYRRDLVSSGNYRPVPKIVPRAKHVEMPVAVIPAAAGTGNLLDSDDYFEMVSFPEDRIPARAELGIRVSGDSMEPVYHDGQIVWVQKCAELQPGEVGIFLYDGRAFLKVFDEQDPDEDVLEYYTDSYGTVHRQPVLVSYNSEKYDPIVISPYSQFRVFGRVLK